MTMKLGTIPYLAPEIILGQDYDEAVDIWCVGIVLSELLAKKHKFNLMSETNRWQLSVNGETTDEDQVELQQISLNKDKSPSSVLRHIFNNQLRLIGNDKDRRDQLSFITNTELIDDFKSS